MDVSNRVQKPYKKSAELIVPIGDAIQIAPNRTGRSELKLLLFRENM